MKFYEKYYPGCFEELLTYYPDYYKNIYEMNVLLETYGRLLDNIENSTEQAYLNNFILTADDNTLKIWEDIFGITYNSQLSLDQRRRVVISRLMSGKHIGEPELRSIISNYTDKPVSIALSGSSVRINIDGEVFDTVNMLKTLEEKLPAHLGIDISVKIAGTSGNDLFIGGCICICENITIGKEV